MLHGKATLTYVNHSPDTLREMRVQQLLNAFRPGSRWSEADEREGRVRFQKLKEPNYGYERFTSAPRVNGEAVTVTYPFAPDSTIARFELPHALAPGDSAIVDFAWDARPSATIYRRQGRKGRHYDFSQWYPKVAVYDRGGWEAQPFIPNGEMYGEFGTFDVTLNLAADQVVGATGVPVAGDPGWEKAKVWGDVHLGRDAYGATGATGATGAIDTALPAVASGRKAVRFYARDVHHFGWSVDPDFKYEGALYRGAIPIHVLITPAEMAKLGHGVFVMWNEHALEFLEKIYGPYGYPQLTGLIRLDPGATEFPMMAMYGDPSEGTVSHEVGHIYSYGMLANNEWREGWLDEGLTSYQSEWRIRETPQDVAEGAPEQGPPPAAGYRAHAHVMSAEDRSRVQLYDVDLLGRAQAPEPPSGTFNEFNIYQMAVYSRPDLMYGMLRDMLGDSVFTAFLHDYYARWKFKHVDELAMRASAERVSGRDLGWFFEQWVHHTGLVDYSLADVQAKQDGGGWLTRATLVKRGDYRHPMPVGVRTSAGWTLGRSATAGDEQTVEIRTAERPLEVRLDPRHSTEDWDRRNDVHGGGLDGSTRVEPCSSSIGRFWRRRIAIATSLRSGRSSGTRGPGGATGAVRLRTNYATVGDVAIDKGELGIAVSAQVPAGARRIERLMGWATIANPRLPWSARPIIGLSAGAWFLDGISKLEIAKEWNLSPFLYANGPQKHLRLGLDATLPYDTRWMDLNRWQPKDVYDANAEYSWASRKPGTLRARVRGIAGVDRDVGGGTTRSFARIEGEVSQTGTFDAAKLWTHRLRFFAGGSANAPAQRSIGLASLDVTDTYTNDFLRGRDALFARSDVHFVVPGGAGLRGYSPLVLVDKVAALNGELTRSIVQAKPKSMVPSVQLVAFADGAWGRAWVVSDDRIFADAGVGVLARGQLWDRAITVRFDLPLYVRDPAFAPGGEQGDDRVKLRWTFSFADLW